MNNYGKWIVGLRHWVYFPKSKVLRFLETCDDPKYSRIITSFENVEYLAKDCSNLQEIIDIIADIRKGIKQQQESNEAIRIARNKDYKMMFHLVILGDLTESLELELQEILKIPMIDEGVFITDYMVWESYQYDLLQLSKKYPKNIFILNYQGSFWNDLGRVKAQNGLVFEQTPMIIYKTDY